MAQNAMTLMPWLRRHPLLGYFALAYGVSWGGIFVVLAVWSLIIPAMVLPDGSNLRPFQIVVGILVLTAVALLCSGE